MKLTSLEATSLAKTLRKWQLFYQPEATQPDQRGPEGGVGILVQDDIPSIRAKAHSDEAGQWIRVSCPGFHIYSAYRTPSLNQQMYHGFDKALTEDMVALGRSPSLCLGDFNHDPLTMHTFQASLTRTFNVFSKTQVPTPNFVGPLNPPDGKETDVSIGVLPMTLTLLSFSATTSGRIIGCCAGICPRWGFSGHEN